MKREIVFSQLMIKNNYYINLYLEKILSEYNLNVTQYLILNKLYETKGYMLSFKTIEKELVIGQSVVVRSIDNIENNGYVSISTDNRDKRVRIAEITDKGRKAALEIKKELLSADNVFLSHLNDSDKMLFKSDFSYCTENIIEYLKEDRTEEIDVKDRRKNIVNKKIKDISNQLLVFEQDDSYAVMIKSIFKYDIKCEIVDKTENALLNLKNKNYDGIIVDIDMLNESDALEFIKNIFSIINICKIPVIVLSSEIKDKIIEDSLNMGVEDIIQAPFNPILFKNRVLGSIEKNNRISELEQIINSR